MAQVCIVERHEDNEAYYCSSSPIFLNSATEISAGKKIVHRRRCFWIYVGSVPLPRSLITDKLQRKKLGLFTTDNCTIEGGVFIRPPLRQPPPVFFGQCKCCS